MLQILGAVEYCHRLKIVHRYLLTKITKYRDLKPENIVFEGDKISSSIKIIDFGRSRILKNKQTINELAGSVFLHNFMTALIRCYIWHLRF